IRDRTAIIITHRAIPGLVFDRNFVMDRGRIIEEGTHESLMRSGKAYREIMERQLAADIDTPEAGF
ncbi:MAG: ABC transporter, partial [Chitinophagia bacterium]|nr:ABC transporter [Chitinophagia bacterium]